MKFNVEVLTCVILLLNIKIYEKKESFGICTSDKLKSDIKDSVTFLSDFLQNFTFVLFFGRGGGRWVYVLTFFKNKDK